MDLRDELQHSLSDSYTLERELDGAGMSRVFVARDTTLGRKVVVKTLESAAGADVSVERFRREIRLAASLQQANIVPLLTAGDVEGRPYYTMPFVEGESLRARLASHGPLSIPETVSILRDVARALAFAHARGVVHRDIKPDNILISGNTAVVTDFGIAKALAAAQTSPRATLTQLGMALGTPAYVAPEQVAADPDVDHRADLYALGVVAYELLTGETPFAGRSAQRLFAAHLTEKPVEVATRRRDTPAALAALVMRCLEKDPALRPSTGEEILSVLESASMHEPPRDGSAGTKPGIAILPLVNLSASVDDEYFSDGVTDDIITQLAQVAGLKVISRTSVMRYKRTEKSLKEIAAELGVSHVVEGSVRRAGQRLRIVVQLIDAESDDHLWAHTFDRELTDVFAIQSEVALHIASALTARLSPTEQAHVGKRHNTANLEAYDAYLRARFQWSKGTADGYQMSVRHFEHALELDPDYALAHIGLAGVLVISTIFLIGEKERRGEAFARARHHALRARECDSTLLEVDATLGYINLWYDWRWTEADRLLARAVEKGPNSAIAHNYRTVYFANLGQAELAIIQARSTIDLDPLWPTAHHDLGFANYQAGRFAESVAACDRAIELAPDFVPALCVKGFALLELGDCQAAIELFRRCVILSPEFSMAHASLAVAHARSGGMNEARQATSDLVRRSREAPVQPSALAWAHAAVGDLDSAFEAIERMIVERDAFVVSLATFSFWDPLRADPRFVEILVRLRFPESLRLISNQRARRSPATGESEPSSPGFPSW